MATTEKLRNRLMVKLTELFQLDQPDLDFGFYRIMQAKAQQVKSFIDKDLLQIIEDTFGQVDEGRKAELAAAVEKAIGQAKKYGAPDPEATDVVMEARAFQLQRYCHGFENWLSAPMKSHHQVAQQSLRWIKCGIFFSQKKQMMDLESLLS